MYDLALGDSGNMPGCYLAERQFRELRKNLNGGDTILTRCHGAKGGSCILGPAKDAREGSLVAYRPPIERMPQDSKRSFLSMAATRWLGRQRGQGVDKV